MRPADRAWLAVACFPIAFNAWACWRDHEMMSEAFDSYLSGRHRWIAELGAALVYTHVTNKVAPRYDVVHLLFVGIRKVLKRS